MKSRVFAVVVASALLTTSAFAQKFSTRLKGLNETPVVFSVATGHATITISDDERSIQYELTYSGLEGSTGPDPTAAPPGSKNRIVTQAHIHVGRPTIAGGVVVFFCGGGPAGHVKPACDPAAGPGTGFPTVMGTWTVADISGGAVSQGIESPSPNAQNTPPNPPNEAAFARFVKAIKDGLSYVNVHTSRSPAGEIRGQLKRDHDRDHDRDDDDND